jgi:hypothetical protein
VSLRWVNGWVTLETIINALEDSELGPLDSYHENNPSDMFQKESQRLRESAEEAADGVPDGSRGGSEREGGASEGANGDT